jgi:hypothetical protein
MVTGIKDDAGTPPL